MNRKEKKPSLMKILIIDNNNNNITNNGNKDQRFNSIVKFNKCSTLKPHSPGTPKW